MPSGDLIAVGKDLVGQCLSRINSQDDPSMFPPKLFILMVSPEWLDEGRAERLFSGIKDELKATEACSNAAL